MSRKTQEIGLSFPYDWSNPNIADDTLIARVLIRGLFDDVCKVCAHYGVERIKQIASGLDDEEFWNSHAIPIQSPPKLKEIWEKSLRRMLENIEAAFSLKQSVTYNGNGAGELAHQLARAPTLEHLRELKRLMHTEGLTLQSINEYALAVSPMFSMDAMKNILTGLVPANGEQASCGELTEIYKYFNEQVRKYEIEVAKRWLSHTPRVNDNDSAREIL